MANTEDRQSGIEARRYCSEQNASESLWGTADTVDVWICLEYRPVWKARALTDNALAEPSREWLAETLAALEARGHKGRVLFIRQPGREADDIRLQVATGGRTFEFSGTGYGFLQDIDLTDAVTDTDRLTGSARELFLPQYFVCTNGQRDLCCARYGLPVYNALTERLGARVWQATHLGGHRFAPNVLVFPDACLYGRIQPDAVDAFLACTEAGAVDFSHLRGRTAYPPIVQAAEALLGRQAVHLLHVTGDAGQARVQFADASERYSVSVRRAQQPLTITKSCGDEEAQQVFPFQAA